MLKDALVRFGVLPSRYAWPNPFKIAESGELLEGIEIRKTDVVLALGCGSGFEIGTLLEDHGVGDTQVWPIVRSPYAKRPFEAGIQSRFQYRRYSEVWHHRTSDRRRMAVPSGR